ncbi:MAG: DUF362 domain-containing protein [Chloroflexi bacterium]|nr:DUF362 domain-containing protein [Chloroflexota bacterium]
MAAQVVVRSTRTRLLDEAVRSLMETCQWEEIVPRDGCVALKLNLNTAVPEKIESANTSPALVESVCRVLQARTHDIALVEAHAYRNSAEEAFAATGIYEVAQRVGAKVINLSHEPCREVGNPILGALPAILLDADVFMTLPVVKTHALTYFTGSLKNQWGCVPRYDRISLHWALDELLVDLQRLLKPQLCIMDGIIGVDRRGPTNGRPRRLDIVLGSADAVALDATAMRLVGLDPTRARHVVMAAQAGLGKFQPEDIQIDSDWEPEPGWTPFEPAQLDWAVAGMNRLSRYAWFRRYFLEVTPIFAAGKRMVNFLRKVGIVR